MHFPLLVLLHLEGLDGLLYPPDTRPHRTRLQRDRQQRLEHSPELVVLEAVDDEVKRAIEDDEEMGQRHRDVHEAPPVSL